MGRGWFFTHELMTFFLFNSNIETHEVLLTQKLKEFLDEYGVTFHPWCMTKFYYW